MRGAVLVVLVGCASAPASHGSADEALAATAPTVPDESRANECEPPRSMGAGLVKRTGTYAAPIAVMLLPLALALDANDRANSECRARAEHDRDAAAFQRARAAAAVEDTPALVRRIEAAARAGDCKLVRALEGALDDRDPEEHDRLYLHAPQIRRCMGS